MVFALDSPPALGVWCSFRLVSALASLAKVSQPRMTQILNLTLLAPDIQERLLCLEPVEEGKAELNEKMLRLVCAEVGWERQRVTLSGLLRG